MASEEGYRNHYGFVRFRVKGVGDLKLTLYSLDETKSAVIPPLTLASTTNIEPTKKCNFSQQRAQLLFYTTEIDETFQMNKVIFFLKPVAENYPG